MIDWSFLSFVWFTTWVSKNIQSTRRVYHHLLLLFQTPACTVGHNLVLDQCDLVSFVCLIISVSDSTEIRLRIIRVNNKSKVKPSWVRLMEGTAEGTSVTTLHQAMQRWHLQLLSAHICHLQIKSSQLCWTASNVSHIAFLWAHSADN